MCRSQISPRRPTLAGDLAQSQWAYSVGLIPNSIFFPSSSVCHSVSLLCVCVQELEEGLASHQPDLAVLTHTGEQIIGQLSSLDGPLLEEKLNNLSQRWRAVSRQVLDRQRR